MNQFPRILQRIGLSQRILLRTPDFITPAPLTSHLKKYMEPTSPSSRPGDYTDQQRIDDNECFQIVVQVVDPITKKEGVSSYTAYSVRGEDKLGEFSVLHRFSDFDVLRRIMQQRWPSCYVPPIPEKKSVGNTDQVFIEDRRRLLEFFIQKVAQLIHLWYSEEFQVFIRGASNDLEKALGKLSIQSNEDLIQKYATSFMYLSGKEINPQIEGKIDSFASYLRRINLLLVNYKEFLKKSLEIRDSSKNQNELLVSYLIPEYEKNCLSEYVSGGEAGVDAKLVFAQSSDEKITSLLSQIKEFMNRDELQSVYQLIRQEIREIEAFIECMESRRLYRDHKEGLMKKHRDLKGEESKIISGKSSIKNMFSKKSASDVKTQIEGTESEISRVSEIYDIMTVILGYVEIDRFKAEKEAAYFKTIKRFAQFEVEFSKLVIIKSHGFSWLT